ncbi:MAG TPA: transposase [Pseudonocardiaceae bacterium]|nr:transposase [Pseudonocardiaceae bacterium]
MAVEVEAYIAAHTDQRDAEPTGQILAAWIAKEELRALLAAARTGGQRHDIAHRLHRFHDWCARTDVPELARLATTIDAWWPEALGFLRTGVTNAGTEATNRTVKTVARTAYGFRNLDNSGAEYGTPAPDNTAGSARGMRVTSPSSSKSRYRTGRSRLCAGG